MMVDGKTIASEILQGLKQSVVQIKNQGITPALTVFLVGNDPGSLSYVRQKEKAAKEIGAEIHIKTYAPGVSKDILIKDLDEATSDEKIHGIILQRPLPQDLNDQKVFDAILPDKDIDGFMNTSPFDPPVALAVDKILRNIYGELHIKVSYDSWMQSLHTTILGKGITAGKPITHFFREHTYPVSVIDSKTGIDDTKKLLGQADIVISCIGIQGILPVSFLKKGVILISVGIWRDKESKLHGDYEEEKIKDIASFYTPTPGGVGPINVACLMENLIKAASPHN